MNAQDAIKICITKYVDFSGRASRSEYWWFFLFCFIIQIIASMLPETLNLIILLALFLPSLAVLVRRLHDTDRSGWWALLLLIPVLGFLIILFFLLMEGKAEPNRFGNAPA